MVSSACRGLCSAMPLKCNSRNLQLDRSKDYSLPLQVETSVEYDLPSHIYPPKGSEPILMIHPAYTTPVRSRKVSVTSTQSPSVLSSPSVNSKPLSTLQVHGNQPIIQRSASKTKCWCSCGNPNCVSRSSSSSRVTSGLRNSQEQHVLTSKQSNQVPENIVYNSVKNSLINSAELKVQQQQQQQQKQQQKSSVTHKQVQQVTQKQLQLQQQQQIQQAQLQQQMQERAKLQQLQQQLQSQPKTQQKTTAAVPRQPTNNDQLISWSVSGRCHLPCCQPRIGALPPAEFLAPGLPPSLLSRTPVRGPAAGSSPKLRARARRLLNVANTVNLPEYLGATRSCRTNSAGTLAAGSSHAHTRIRSSSMLASTPAPITAHQVASALDVVRSHVLTPRSLYASSQQQQQQTQQQQQQQQLCNINNSTSSLLSTVGQSRDSGCSLSTEMISTPSSNFTNSENATKSVEWNWSVVDSGFCTPVDITDDHLMETYEATPVTSTVTQYISKDSNSNSSTSSTSSSSSSSGSGSWMREFTTPINSSSSSSSMASLHSSFLATPTHSHHYMPQPLWNLAY